MPKIRMPLLQCVALGFVLLVLSVEAEDDNELVLGSGHQQEAPPSGPAPLTMPREMSAELGAGNLSSKTGASSQSTAIESAAQAAAKAVVSAEKAKAGGGRVPSASGGA